MLTSIHRQRRADQARIAAYRRAERIAVTFEVTLTLLVAMGAIAYALAFVAPSQVPPASPLSHIHQQEK